jgi:hypothetical protein
MSEHPLERQARREIVAYLEEIQRGRRSLMKMRQTTSDEHADWEAEVDRLDTLIEWVEGGMAREAAP